LKNLSRKVIKKGHSKMFHFRQNFGKYRLFGFLAFFNKSEKRSHRASELGHLAPARGTFFQNRKIC